MKSHFWPITGSLPGGQGHILHQTMQVGYEGQTLSYDWLLACTAEAYRLGSHKPDIWDGYRILERGSVVGGGWGAGNC